MANEFDSLFKGLDTLVKTKTVIGDPMKIDDATIVPIMEVSFGMATGSFAEGKNNAGGMGAKLSPVGLYIIQNGAGRLVHIKNTDAITGAIEMIPDFVNRICGKKVSADIEAKAKKLAEGMEAKTDVIE